MSARPVIGVTGAVDEVSYRSWREVRTAHVPWAYVRALQAGGARAVILPPDPTDAADATSLLSGLDGLIVSGGADVDPATYGAKRHPRTGATDPCRDAFEIALARTAAEGALPLLGICRGAQILNIARGGTLHQHMPDVVGHDGHNPTPGRFAGHEVTVRPGSLAARAAGGGPATVMSHHHQGIARVGDQLEATAWHGDGTVEALEDPRAAFLLGVLWHPEEQETDTVIRALVDAARAGDGLRAPDAGDDARRRA